MPSKDFRRKNARGDIDQHRIQFLDWADDWVFYDDRFNLMHGPGDAFLRFLCATVHPAVRPEAQESLELVREYNRLLSADGCSIMKVGESDGKPIFGPEAMGQRIQISEEPTGWEKVDRQMLAARDQLRTAVNEEDFQGIGLLCCEVLISVSQEIYEPERHKTRNGNDASNTDAKRMLEAFFDAELVLQRRLV